MVWSVLVIYGLMLVFIFSYSMVQLSLVISYKLKRKKHQESITVAKTELKEEDFPIVTIQLPVFNERYVVERLLDKITDLNYPKDKLEIQVLDDSTDETTEIIANKIEALKHKGIEVNLIRRPERVGFKAGALKYGLEICKGEFVAIFDADFLPHKDFLRDTVPYFYSDEKIGVVQTRWGHLNEEYSLLTKLQAFGLDAHFTVEQVGRNIGEHFINFNGTAGVWRKDCIIDAGNWEADTLTEDLDLSYRAQVKGWRFVFLEEVESPAELPVTMPALKSQQFRWTKGAAETAMKNLKRVFKANLPFGTKLHAFFHLLNSSIFVCVLISGLLSLPALYIKNEIPDYDIWFKIASFCLVSFFTLGFYYYASYFRFREASLKELGQFVKTFPLFLSLSMGLSLHNAIAVIEGYIGKKTPFVRTPKFNLTDAQEESWKKNIYRAKQINPLTLVEGFFTLYFLAGIALGIHYADYGLMLFHVMLTFGYANIVFYTIKHAKFS
ncbi:MAG: glycosyltransferase [Cytophagales bacterium]|nr:glycosyltransferase [Cytophagales bacterium]